MEWLIIKIMNQSVYVAFENIPELTLQSIMYHGEAFHCIGQNCCFEWLFDTQGNVVGVELNPDTSVNLELSRAIQRGSTGSDRIIPSIDFSSGFPIIWFTNKKAGLSRHFQDWEDYYYSNGSDIVLVALRTHMLATKEIDRLSQLIQSLDNH